MSVEGAITTHVNLALKEMQESLGASWDKLTSDQRASAARAAQRIVELEWEKRTKDAYITEDLAFVLATVDGFKLIAEIALYDAFWKGMNKALEALGSFLVGAGKSLIPGLGTVFAGINLGAIFNVS